MKYQMLLLTVVLGVLLSGCVEVVTRKCDCRCRPCPPRRSEEPPVLVDPGCQITDADFADEDAVIEEINQVGSFAFEDNKVERYQAIARRPYLTPKAQTHLVEAIFSRLAFEDSKIDSLIPLIGNPCFSCRARQKITTSVHRLAFESNRMKILEVIDKRGPCVEFR